MDNTSKRPPDTRPEKAVSTPEPEAAHLFADLAHIIDGRKQTLYRQVNSGIVMMFWEVGKRINEEVLRGERAEYGKQIVATVSRQLEIQGEVIFV